MHDARLLSPGFALHQPHERGAEVRSRPRPQRRVDRKPCRQTLTGSASMAASPRFRVSYQTALTAKHSLEPFANHPFRLPCRIAPRSFPKLLRLLLKNLRLFLLPGILLQLGKIWGGGGSALLHII